MKEIKPQLAHALNKQYGRPIEILSIKYLGIKGWGVKFIFLDTGFEKSQLVRLQE